MKSLFKVNGKPFFTIGGQVNNSSNYNEEDIIRSFEIAKRVGINTIAIPFYWNQIEVEEGKYDTSAVDRVLRLCKENDLRLCIIWFGTYKNGASTYAPEYVKRNHDKYWPIYTTNGHVSATLSPVCKETSKRDREAFKHLLLKVKELDKDGIVIGFQIENEAGCLGPARDYSERGNRQYREKVPADLIKMLESLKKPCPILDYYNESKRKKNGNWEETFGFYAPDIFMAYHLAKYVNNVAEAAKQILPNIPRYMNCWTYDNGCRVPGISYPSGGPTKNAYEIYKTFCPNIDMLTADTYALGLDEFEAQALPYARKDNQFFIPETYPYIDQYPIIFKMIREHQLTGIHSLGIDTLLEENGELKESAVKYKQVVDILNNSKELLEKYIGTEDFIAVYQMYGEQFKVYELGGYIIKVVFFNKNDPWIAHVDAKHRGPKATYKTPLGFIFKDKADGVFYLTGQGFVARFTKKENVEKTTDSLLYDDAHNKNAFHQFISIEEGEFANNKFTTKRRRNGDEIDYGVWVEDDIGVARIKL